MPNITFRLSDAQAAALDARAAQHEADTFVRVGRAGIVQAAVSAFLAQGSTSTTAHPRRPLPPKTRTRPAATA